jgi:hypothetical protein
LALCNFSSNNIISFCGVFHKISLFYLLLMDLKSLMMIKNCIVTEGVKGSDFLMNNGEICN